MGVSTQLSQNQQNNPAWLKQQMYLQQLQPTGKYPPPYPQRQRTPLHTTGFQGGSAVSSVVGSSGSGVGVGIGIGGGGNIGVGIVGGNSGVVGCGTNINFDQQQYVLQQGLKSNNSQIGGGVLSATLQQQGQLNQNVMGPPTPQQTLQQQLMQSVRSPPPIRSPQPTASPRPTPSPRAQPSPSPRAQPSPHHMSSHSPAPQQVVGGNSDMHNHMHPHQSPIPGVSTDSLNAIDVIPGLTAQDQLTKFVEQL